MYAIVVGKIKKLGSFKMETFSKSLFLMQYREIFSTFFSKYPFQIQSIFTVLVIENAVNIACSACMNEKIVNKHQNNITEIERE